MCFLGLKLTAKLSPSDAAVSNRDRAMTAVAGRRGGQLSPPFELPLEQAIARPLARASGLRSRLWPV